MSRSAHAGYASGGNPIRRTRVKVPNIPVPVPGVNSANEHCSVRPSEWAAYSVVKVSSKSGTGRVQTAAVNQFGWKDVPFSDSLGKYDC